MNFPIIQKLKGYKLSVISLIWQIPSIDIVLASYHVDFISKFLHANYISVKSSLNKEKLFVKPYV